jgi:IS30 family transposase
VIDIKELVEKFQENKLTNAQIAEMYGVEESTIRNIRLRKRRKKQTRDYAFDSENPTNYGKRKFDCETVKLIRQKYEDGETITRLSQLFKLSRAPMRLLVNHLTYKEC